MEYVVLHATRYDYQSPVVESVMEVRKTPRHDAHQELLAFDIAVEPCARVHAFSDALGNDVRHFDVPQAHRSLVVVTRSRVRVDPARLGVESLPPEAFVDLDRAAARGEHWDFLQPSRYAQATARVRAFADELGIARAADPLTTMRKLTDTLNREMTYEPESTRVDTSADEAVAARKGVCQDFAHLEATLARLCGIPCRYVSGYLASTGAEGQRGESHAWVEAWLPGLGWTGFDPTHNIVTGVHHIRVAVGRDYADVPPTRGVCKGEALGRLAVAVGVWEAAAAPAPEDVDVRAMLANARSVSAGPSGASPDLPLIEPQQQQQQQQQELPQRQ